MSTPLLTLEQWSAWASGLESPEAWLDWFENPTISLEEKSAPAKSVPPLMRRRLSALGRCAIESVMAIYTDSDREQRTPIIFASRWGDIGLSVKLLHELCEEGGVSPMGFSTSVHNGIGGLFSISQKHRANIVALSGTETTTSVALFEAIGLLKEGAQSVIAIIYEERSPDDFARFHPANFTYAWAVRLRLAAPEENGVQVTSDSKHLARQNDTTDSLQALRFFVTPSIEEWIDEGFPISYRWTKS